MRPPQFKAQGKRSAAATRACLYKGVDLANLAMTLFVRIHEWGGRRLLNWMKVLMGRNVTFGNIVLGARE
jgi:hypothetical protein